MTIRDSAQTQHRPATLSPQIITLVKKATAGQRSAFNQLIDQYQNAIMRMVYYRVRIQMDAEDLTQEIFFKAYRNISRLKDPERFRSWLFSIAINRIRDYYRKNKFLKLFGALPEKEDTVSQNKALTYDSKVHENLLKQEFWQQVSNALNILSPKEREVFLLRFFDQLSLKEISQTLQKSESTVKTHLYRALSKFKKERSITILLGNGQNK